MHHWPARVEAQMRPLRAAEGAQTEQARGPKWKLFFHPAGLRNDKICGPKNAPIFWAQKLVLRGRSSRF